ncbi:MAG TPA: hypothetical protein VGP07_09135 [Polyangia bacterium]|jgi:hypothetical protein
MSTAGETQSHLAHDLLRIHKRRVGTDGALPAGLTITRPVFPRPDSGAVKLSRVTARG